LAKSAYDKLLITKLKAKRKKNTDLDCPFSLRAKFHHFKKYCLDSFFLVLLPIDAKCFFELPLNDATQENFKEKNLVPNAPQKHFKKR
jgi:hypothetical protein